MSQIAHSEHAAVPEQPGRPLREAPSGLANPELASPETASPESASAEAPVAQLLALRGSIDNIDAALIHMLAERFRCTQAVGELKARHNMPPADPEREVRQVARLRTLARDARLDPDFAEKFLAFVIREVIRHHEAIARDRQDGRGDGDGTQPPVQPGGRGEVA